MILDWVKPADGKPEELIPQPEPFAHRIPDIVIAPPAFDFDAVGNDRESLFFRDS